MADQIPEERQWALILVAGGDEAYNHWDTLEDTVKDRKVAKQVWDAFEKSFEQSTSFWHEWTDGCHSRAVSRSDRNT